MDTPKDGHLEFYLMMDALIDSRAGTLMRLSPDWAIKAVGSDDYHARMSDDLVDVIADPKYDQKHFEALYKARDKSTLFYSRSSCMLDYVRSLLLNQAMRKLTGDPRIDTLSVTINTYPYHLDAGDIEVYRRVFAATLKVGERQINMEYRPLREMSLHWLNVLRPACIVLYDLNEWLLQCSDFPKTPNEVQTAVGSPETVVLAAGLLADRHSLHKLKTMDRSESNDKDPFTLSRKGLAWAFALEVLPARYYSVQRYVKQETPMADLNQLQQQIFLMNKIAGREQNNSLKDILTQTVFIAEEFKETMGGLLEGMRDGKWDEFRNGLGDMLVVIFGQENMAEFPIADDLEIIMEKNLAKFDTDLATASTSLQRMRDLGYKCEIQEKVIEGKTYYPILTTESGVVTDSKGERKHYGANKFLKSINWSEEVLKPVGTLPLPDEATDADYLRAAQLCESLAESLSSLGKAFRSVIKDA